MNTLFTRYRPPAQNDQGIPIVGGDLPDIGSSVEYGQNTDDAGDDFSTGLYGPPAAQAPPEPPSPNAGMAGAAGAPPPPTSQQRSPYSSMRAVMDKIQATPKPVLPKPSIWRQIAGTLAGTAIGAIGGQRKEAQQQGDALKDAIEYGPTAIQDQGRYQADMADLSGRMKLAQEAEQTSQAADKIDALGQRNEALADLARTKQTASDNMAHANLELKQEHERRVAADAKAKADLNLAKSGHKLDDNGQVVPLTYEEMSPEQQAVVDLKSSQQELAEANAAYAKAKAENIPASMELAKRRIDNANHTADIAARRLGLSEATYNARYLGTDVSGNALPGAMITDDGRSVGSTFSQNVRPTGTQRTKGDLANSAAEQVADIKSIIHNRPDIFGPAAGRKTNFDVWLGSQDPDAQRFRAARTIAGDHLAGVFGGRSETALNALDEAIGQFKDNPKAIDAGLDQVLRGNSVFQKSGTVKTVGSANSSPKQGGAVVQTPNGAVDLSQFGKSNKTPAKK